MGVWDGATTGIESRGRAPGGGQRAKPHEVDEVLCLNSNFQYICCSFAAGLVSGESMDE